MRNLLLITILCIIERADPLDVTRVTFSRTFEICQDESHCEIVGLQIHIIIAIVSVVDHIFIYQRILAQ